MSRYLFINNTVPLKLDLTKKTKGNQGTKMLYLLVLEVMFAQQLNPRPCVCMCVCTCMRACGCAFSLCLIPRVFRGSDSGRGSSLLDRAIADRRQLNAMTLPDFSDPETGRYTHLKSVLGVHQ